MLAASLDLGSVRALKGIRWRVIKQDICLALGSACAQEHTYTHIHRYGAGGGEGGKGRDGRREERRGGSTIFRNTTMA